MNLEKTNFVNWFYLDNSFSACAPCINPHLYIHMSVLSSNSNSSTFPQCFMNTKKRNIRLREKKSIVIAWASINCHKVRMKKSSNKGISAAIVYWMCAAAILIDKLWSVSNKIRSLCTRETKRNKQKQKHDLRILINTQTTELPKLKY